MRIIILIIIFILIILFFSYKYKITEGFDEQSTIKNNINILITILNKLKDLLNNPIYKQIEEVLFGNNNIQEQINNFINWSNSFNQKCVTINMPEQCVDINIPSIQGFSSETKNLCVPGQSKDISFNVPGASITVLGHEFNLSGYTTLRTFSTDEFCSTINTPQFDGFPGVNKQVCLPATSITKCFN